MAVAKLPGKAIISHNEKSPARLGQGPSQEPMCVNAKNLTFWARFTSSPEEAMELLGNPTAGAEAIELARWPAGARCPVCNSRDTAPPSTFDLGNKRRYRCRTCARQFNWKSGTWMAGSRISADRFIAAVVWGVLHGREACFEMLTTAGRTDPETAQRLVNLVAENVPFKGESE